MVFDEILDTKRQGGAQVLGVVPPVGIQALEFLGCPGGLPGHRLKDHVHLYKHICIYKSIYKHVYICIYIYIHIIHTHVHIYIYICIYVYVYTYVYVYIYIYTHIHTYIPIHIYIYIYTCEDLRLLVAQLHGPKVAVHHYLADRLRFGSASSVVGLHLVKEFVCLRWIFLALNTASSHCPGRSRGSVPR